jgi:hypothetical protein
LGKAGDSFKNIAEKKGFAVGVMQEREKTEFGKGGKGDRRHINTDRLRRGKNSTKVVVDYGHERVGGDNGMEKVIDSREGGGVCPHIIPYLYSVPPYCPSNPPLS